MPRRITRLWTAWWKPNETGYLQPGLFWYTAWVNAGKPDLAILDPAELTKANREKLEEELALFKKVNWLDLSRGDVVNIR